MVVLLVRVIVELVARHPGVIATRRVFRSRPRQCGFQWLGDQLAVDAARGNSWVLDLDDDLRPVWDITQLLAV
jgi:hypothetical protein